MGKRARKRSKESGGPPTTTSEVTLPDGSVLCLRDELSAGTLRTLGDLDARPAADAEDRWQRRVEFLFERLATRWVIADLPIDSQKELLGRYRMASPEERRNVRQALTEHLAERYPDVTV